jgi:hypothetical protein
LTGRYGRSGCVQGLKDSKTRDITRTFK